MKLIHVSDLHFGKEDKQVLAALIQDIAAIKPAVVIVSGDLTQRARKNQFIKAAEFLQCIDSPTIVVPGNHDLPLYNVAKRFLMPLKGYLKYINDDLFPVFLEQNIIIVGINTAYSFTWKSGKISTVQMQLLKEKLAAFHHLLKILVIHHPYQEIFHSKKHRDFLNETPIDIILAGHLHQASATVHAQTLLIQAGTCISKRFRGDRNSYNLIEVHNHQHLTLTVRDYQNEHFLDNRQVDFIKEGQDWMIRDPISSI